MLDFERVGAFELDHDLFFGERFAVARFGGVARFGAQRFRRDQLAR